MKTDVDEIVLRIKELVDQLASIKAPSSKKTKGSVKVKNKAPKGASGAINLLKDEGFFDTPKDLTAIISKLEEIGHYHSRPTISMNLLNLTKRRVFNRLKDKKTKNWKYVLRR